MTTYALELLDVLSTKEAPMFKAASTLSTAQRIKLARGMCGSYGSDKPWLERYINTPLFDQAMSLEQQDIQLEQQRLEAEAARPPMDQTWRLLDQLRLQKDLLDLQLVQFEQQQSLAGAAAEGAAPPVALDPGKTAGFLQGLRQGLSGLGKGIKDGIKHELKDSAPSMAAAAAAPAVGHALESTRGGGLSRIGQLLSGSRIKDLQKHENAANIAAALGPSSPSAAAAAAAALPAIAQEMQREQALSMGARALTGMGLVGAGGLAYGAMQDHRMQNPNNFAPPAFKGAAMAMPGFLSGLGTRAADAIRGASKGPSLADRIRGALPQSATQRMQAAYKATPTKLGPSVAQQAAAASAHASDVNLRGLQHQVAQQRGAMGAGALPTAAQQQVTRSVATPGHQALMQSMNLPQVNQGPRLAPPKIAFDIGRAVSGVGNAFSKANKATGGRLGTGIAAGVVGGGLAGGMSGNEGFSMSRALAGAAGGGLLGAAGGNVAHQMSKGQSFGGAVSRGLNAMGSQATGMYNSGMKAGHGGLFRQMADGVSKHIPATAAGVAGAAAAAPALIKKAPEAIKTVANNARDAVNTAKGTVSAIGGALREAGPQARDALSNAAGALGVDRAYSAVKDRIAPHLQGALG